MSKISQTALARKISPAAANEARIRQFKDRGVSFSLGLEDDCALIGAYVTSAVATRMLAPLGRKAIGQFEVLPDNMVLVEAIVSHNMAKRMLFAAREAA
jgi:hypothetical protein